MKWSVSLQAISMFRAQGLIKNSGWEVYVFFYADLNECEQQDAAPYVHRFVFHLVSVDVETIPP